MREPFVQDSDFTLWHGDALEVLRELPDESVDCVATSPPFYALRDYGVEGQIGLRCTTSHSYVFLFAKRARYHFDAQAIAEPAEWARWGDQTTPKHNGTDTAAGWIQPKTKRELMAEVDHRYEGLVEQRWKQRKETRGSGVGERGHKNARSVWTIPTRGYPGAHFATWPEVLAERIIKAGCPESVCATCGKPRERITERETAPDDVRRLYDRKSDFDPRAKGLGGQAHQDWLDAHPKTTVGWSDCGHYNYRPGVVLDPFGGSGTTALVARRHGRRSILIELNESYCRLAAERLQQLSLLAEPA